ncbi:MAG TPA: GAP family protein [Candidatus Saccharimonadales bacterium]|nr:GAP family protein [Candidatus Saccharimonadales bacterium]
MTTSVLIGALIALALVDSINPSALFATGYILLKAPSERKTAAVLAYVAGIFIAYILTGGILLLGLQALLSTASGVAQSWPVYVLQGLLGLGMLIWSFLPPKPKNKVSRLMPRLFTTRAMLILGAVITLAEFITAFPYFAAIGLLQQSGQPFLAIIGILAVYNLIFVLPPLGMLAAYYYNRPRFEAWLQKRKERQKDKPNTTMQWIVGILGVMLALNAVGALIGK